MLRSDWLSYYWAICYSPLVAKSAGLDFTKTIIPLALMASESIAHEAEGRMGY